MDHLVSRVNVLVWQLRARVKKYADIQRNIRNDIHLFTQNDQDVKWKFETTRQYYLDHLKITVVELREAISTSDIALPTVDLDTEDIMKRVRPITERYLRRLVSEKVITTSDMDCIIVGKYSSVEEFLDDMTLNVESIGVSSEGIVSGEFSYAAIASYDENGFFVGDDRTNQAGAENLTQPSEPVGPSSEDMASPTFEMLPPSVPFSWADDEDEDFNIYEPPIPLERQSSTLPEPAQQEEEEAPPKDDDDDTLSDKSSVFDFTVTEPEGAGQAPEPQQPSEAEQEAQVDPEELSDASEDQDEFPVHITPKQVIDLTFRTLSRNPDGTYTPTETNEVLDIWLEDHDMWYWQYEVVFAASLLATQYEEQFQDARKAYKADPFADD
ncbi:uncharacterized protein F4822DRAFT_430600 [Hypoxylon trugodes]|uniref:uncharacterized protein n=1 Tax=Hypoxylon trugodes TaxID=326681 RepID=UPI00219578F1|nr:uncharacterized protein F4822DRAFT_430600 [Hypoxylon trugodes]KAI1387854.1 hypothetical protein F4822DRAFT_430600 [Hypoxylon trugodes]